MNKIKTLFLSASLAFSVGHNLLKANEIEFDTGTKVDSLLSGKSSNSMLEELEERSLSKQEKENLIKSKNNLGDAEWNNFLSFFDLDTKKEILEKIRNISPKDSILGEKSLEKLYLEYYSKNPSKLSDRSKYRLEIYNEMAAYSKKSKNTQDFGKIKASGQIKVFNRFYYFGYNSTYPYKDTFVDESLVSRISDKIDEMGNIAFLEKIDGEYVAYLYVNGILQLATYASPGNPNQPGAINTPTGKFLSKSSDMYHISAAKVSVSYKNGTYYGAIMPYAVSIIGGVYIHSGSTTGDKASHGCVRVPLYYAKAFYELFEKYGEIKWSIRDTR